MNKRMKAMVALGWLAFVMLTSGLCYLAHTGAGMMGTSYWSYLAAAAIGGLAGLFIFGVIVKVTERTE